MVWDGTHFYFLVWWLWKKFIIPNLWKKFIIEMYKFYYKHIKIFGPSHSKLGFFLNCSGHSIFSLFLQLYKNEVVYFLLKYSWLTILCFSNKYTAKSDSITYIYIFKIMFYYQLLQDVECNSPCYTINPCCLSILCTVCVYRSLYLLIPYS